MIKLEYSIDKILLLWYNIERRFGKGRCTLVRYYRGRKRRKSRAAILLSAIVLVLFLFSGIAAFRPQAFKSLFGESVAAYQAEPVQQYLRTDGETAYLLTDYIHILTSGSANIKGFHGASDAVKYYRDEILNDMLRDHYALYTGNSTHLSVVNAAYPNGAVSTWIPASEFENAVARYFGEASVYHKSGTVFSYLHAEDGYTAPIQSWESRVEVTVLALEETANAYRMRFALTDEEGGSASYRALFVKRSDGSCYLYALDLLA